MIAEGTTATSTTIQRNADAEATILAAADAALIAAFHAAATKAQASAKALAGDVVELAHTVNGLHVAQTWSRQVDPATGKPFTSAKAYYGHLFESGESPLASPDRTLQTVLRRELVQCLMDPDNLELILGNNELAALVGVDQATISRDVDRLTPALEEAKALADAAAEAEAFAASLDEATADAVAAALADGKDEESAAYAGEVARAALKATADKEAKAAADAEAADAAKAEADAEAKATEKAVRAMSNAVDAVLQRDHHLTAAQRATVLEKARLAVSKLEALEALIAKAEADADAAAKANAAKAAKANADAEASLRRAEANNSPKPSARGRKVG
jgi:hypothetical protein